MCDKRVLSQVFVIVQRNCISNKIIGGAGDCFFRAVSHQLYGEPSYHMNIRCAT